MKDFEDVSSQNLSLLLEGCNGSVTQDIQYSESIFYSFILLATVVLATYGNLLVILAIARNRELRTFRNAILCSLTVVDMLSPILRLLPIAISTIAGRWIFGCTSCIISSGMAVFFCSASILHLCAITIERYVTIRFPMRSKVFITKTKLGVLFFVIWTLAVMMALIPHLSDEVVMYFNSYLIFCDFYLVHSPQLSVILAFVFFGLPFILMVIVYFQIYRMLVANNKRISVYSAGNSTHRSELKRRNAHEWKAVKMIIVIVGVFFVLWLPYFTVTVVKSYLPDAMSSWVHRLVVACAYVNSCCNWVVYSIMNVKLRQAFIKLHPLCIRRRLAREKPIRTEVKRKQGVVRQKTEENDESFRENQSNSAALKILPIIVEPYFSGNIPELHDGERNRTSEETVVNEMDRVSELTNETVMIVANGNVITEEIATDLKDTHPVHELTSF